MEVINIIVTHPETPIVSIDSFGIADSQLRNEVVEQAEQAFVEKCVELFYNGDSGTDRNDLKERNAYREDVSESIEDGYHEVGENTVSFVWSYVENIQS